MVDTLPYEAEAIAQSFMENVDPQSTGEIKSSLLKADVLHDAGDGSTTAASSELDVLTSCGTPTTQVVETPSRAVEDIARLSSWSNHGNESAAAGPLADADAQAVHPESVLPTGAIPTGVEDVSQVKHCDGEAPSAEAEDVSLVNPGDGEAPSAEAEDVSLVNPGDGEAPSAEAEDVSQVNQCDGEAPSAEAEDNSQVNQRDGEAPSGGIPLELDVHMGSVLNFSEARLHD